MTTQQPAALIDPQIFNEVASQMPQKIGVLVEYFTADATEHLAALDTALNGPATDPVTVVGSLAHQLKASARQLGAVLVAQTAQELEHACRSRPLAPLSHLQQLHQQLATQLPPTLRQLADLAAARRPAI